MDEENTFHIALYVGRQVFINNHSFRFNRVFMAEGEDH